MARTDEHNEKISETLKARRRQKYDAITLDDGVEEMSREKLLDLLREKEYYRQYQAEILSEWSEKLTKQQKKIEELKN